MKERLIDIFEPPISGEWGTDTYELHRVPVLRTTNFTDDGRLDYENVVYRGIDIDKYNHKILCDGDIIIEKSGGTPKKPVGRVVLFDKKTSDIYFCNNFTAILRPKANNFPPYLLYMLQYLYNIGRVKSFQNKTTGIANLQLKNYLQETIVNIPSIEVQKEIAFSLINCQNIIDNCNHQLVKLDELVKSRFIEMFGDPVTNPMGWKVKKLKDLSHKISDGVHAKPKYTDEGKPFISVVNINTGNIDFSNCKFVSEADYEKMIKSTHPEKGDVLYTKVGATYGIPAYVDTDKDFCLYVSVCLIKPKHELVNARFLTESMRLPYIKHQADRRIRGIGVPDLHLNQIREFYVLCPPIDLQERYIEFVELANKSKLVAKALLAKVELLREKLMQDYFC